MALTAVEPVNKNAEYHNVVSIDMKVLVPLSVLLLRQTLWGQPVAGGGWLQSPTPYMYSLAEELLRFVNVSRASPEAVGSVLQGRDWIPSVELYVMSPHGNEQQLEEFFVQWAQFDVAP